MHHNVISHFSPTVVAAFIAIALVAAEPANKAELTLDANLEAILGESKIELNFC